MKLTQIKINNFRTISSEITLDLQTKKTIVGPNNSGKTNILKAIYYFFYSLRNNVYQTNLDSPFANALETGTTAIPRTSIVGTFRISESEDAKFLDKFNTLLSYLDKERQAPEFINLYLQYSTNNKPSYRFIINEKIKPDKQEAARQLQEELIESLLGSFSCKYIPSEKKFNEIYDSFILPHLRESVGTLLQSQLEKYLRILR